MGTKTKTKSMSSTRVAKCVLIGQAALVGAVGMGIFVMEIPGLVREIRIWRMAGFRAGSRHPR